MPNLTIYDDCETLPVNDLMRSFAGTVLSEAKKFLGCKEDPDTPNRSYCVDKIQELGGWTPSAESWCAMYVFAIVDKSCMLFDIKNKLPRTKSTRTMLNNAPKYGLEVDKKPAKGSVFFIPRGDSGIYGHVGFVADIKGNEIYTIEGNSSNQVKLGKRKIFDEMRFIHTEKMTTDKRMTTALKVAGGLLLIGGLWYGAKKIT